MDKVVFVVVNGLSNQESGGRPSTAISKWMSARYGGTAYYLWDSNWLEGMGYDNCRVIKYDAGFNKTPNELDFLSPTWFDQKAEDLLITVKGHQVAKRQESRFVFCGENLGGIIVKRALISAESDAHPNSISRKTCACILFGVPHKVSTLQEWSCVISAIVLPLWRSLPLGFWKSTATLPEYLGRTSSDFMAVAFSIAIISVCQSPEHQPSAIIDVSCGVLDVSHEHVVIRDSATMFTQIAQFHPKYLEKVKDIFRIIEDATSVTLPARDYMKTLSRLSPYTRSPEHDGVKAVIEAIKNLPRKHKVQAVDLYGDHRVGKSILSYALYENLVRHRDPRGCVAYFAFDARDHRRRRVSVMLIKLIRQLLANEPCLIAKFLDPRSDDRMHWTEGNLWIQLRSIIRQMRSRYIYIVIDSINACDTDNRPGFFRDLSDLRFAAPGRLNIWCTSTKVPELSTNGFHSVDVAEMPEFKVYWAAFQSQLTDVLASESPKLMAAKDCIHRCLDVSEGFLHANLIAGRIRGTSSLSRLSLVTADLAELKKGWKDTITDMVQGVPPWAANAVSWMMFAHRPLKPAELAVAVALIEASPGLEPLAGLDKCNIPLDIEGDIKRQLGPLVNIECGEIAIAHSYVAEVLQAWIQSIQKDEALRLRIPRLLLEYLHQCLRKIVEDKIIPRGPEFAFFEYALEYWHIHYRQVMDDVVRPETEAETWSNKLEWLARTLFDKSEYISWLASRKYLDLEPQNIGEGETTEVSNSPLQAVLLTARLGLFGIFKQLFNPKSQDERLAALKIACRNGHPEIVQYLMEATDNSSVIEALLSEACQRGNEDVVLALIGRREEIPTHLLTNVCSIGHRSLAERLIDAGAKVDAYGRPSETPPLHAAIKQGHLDVVNLLLEKGADANCLDQQGWTPLQCSISRGYSHISDRLLDETGLTDNVNKDNLTSAHLAARLGDVSLLEKVIDLNKSEIREGKEHIFSQPLHEAAANGHLGAVKLLLERGAPINELNSTGKTAFFIALSENYAHVAEYLFEQGAEVATGVKYAESALKQAILHANLKATVMILQKGENPNGVNCTDSSPLTDAARGDHLHIFNALVFAGADYKQRVNHYPAEEILDEDITSGWAAIHFAAYYGSTKITSLLVDLEPTIVDIRIHSGHTPLHLAVFCEKIQISEILLSRGTPTDASVGGRKGSLSNSTNSNTTGPETGVQRAGANVNAVSNRGRTPLHIAATNANSHLVKLLLKFRAYADVSDNDGKTPLHLAAASTPSNNFKEMMSALLSSNADPAARDTDGETPLHHAAQNGNSEAVALLLQAGSPVAPVDDAGFTPLYIAAQTGHDKVVAQLLDSDADANTANKKGYTVLHVSAFEGHVEVVDALLKGGANSDALDDRHDTPLHEAARRGHKHVVDRLIKNHADLNVVNLSRITPLQRAVLNSWTFTVRLLLEAGADPNIRDEDGDTALTAAMFKGVEDVLDILLKQDEQGKLKFNIDLDYKNRHGKTPLMHAVQMPWAIKALLDAGADASICDDNKQTIFHQLASGLPEHQVEDFVKSLLSHANSKAKYLLQGVDMEGITPIHLAAREGNGPLIKAFYDYSPNIITAKDRQGRTAMHHAVKILSKENLTKIFGEFLRPDRSNHVNIPDTDGWTPLHWACRKSREGVVEMLLSQYKHPIRALRYEGRHGWSAMAIALFHKNDDAVKHIESGAMAIDPEWNVFEAMSPGSLPEPQTSAEEALQGCDDGDTFSAPPSQPSRRWSLAVRNGLRSDGKRVIPGASHGGVYCDDCRNYIYGVRFKCLVHADFDLCFKCYWHVSETHQDHSFDTHGEGPIKDPILGAPDLELRRSSPYRRRVSRRSRRGASPPPAYLSGISAPPSPMVMQFDGVHFNWEEHINSRASLNSSSKNRSLDNNEDDRKPLPVSTNAIDTMAESVLLRERLVERMDDQLREIVRSLSRAREVILPPPNQLLEEVRDQNTIVERAIGGQDVAAIKLNQEGEGMTGGDKAEQEREDDRRAGDEGENREAKGKEIV